MNNLNSIKYLIKKYAVTKNERYSRMLILSLSYNLPDFRVYNILSNEERNIIKEACNDLKTKKSLKTI